MKGKSKNIIEYESVKIKKSLVDRVRANKEITGVSITSFFEKAAEDRLSSEKLKTVLVNTDYHASMGEMLIGATNKKKK